MAVSAAALVLIGFAIRPNDGSFSNWATLWTMNYGSGPRVMSWGFWPWAVGGALIGAALVYVVKLLRH